MDSKTKVIIKELADESAYYPDGRWGDLPPEFTMGMVGSFYGWYHQDKRTVAMIAIDSGALVPAVSWEVVKQERESR